jgi:hypothetical protein
MQSAVDWAVAAAWVGAIAGVLGFLLSLWNTYIQHQNTRPHLELVARRGTLVELPRTRAPQLFDGIQVGGTPVMYFKVTNPRQKPLRITELSLEPPNGPRMRLPYIHGDQELPCVVDPVDSTRFWVALEVIGKWLRGEKYTGEVTVTVVVKDALDNIYTDEFRTNADNPVVY